MSNKAAPSTNYSILQSCPYNLGTSHFLDLLFATRIRNNVFSNGPNKVFQASLQSDFVLYYICFYIFLLWLNVVLM